MRVEMKMRNKVQRIQLQRKRKTEKEKKQEQQQGEAISKGEKIEEKSTAPTNEETMDQPTNHFFSQEVTQPKLSTKNRPEDTTTPEKQRICL
jgi:hypothetical protein